MNNSLNTSTIRLLLLLLLMMAPTATSIHAQKKQANTPDQAPPKNTQNNPENNIPERYSPLLENSPFISDAFRARLNKVGKVNKNAYQFHGYARIDGIWTFSIFLKNGNKNLWLKSNETVENLTVTHFNEKKQTLTLKVGDQEIELKPDTRILTSTRKKPASTPSAKPGDKKPGNKAASPKTPGKKNKDKKGSTKKGKSKKKSGNRKRK